MNSTLHTSLRVVGLAMQFPLRWLLVFCLGTAVQAADYVNNKTLAQQIKQLANQHRAVLRSASIAISLGKNEVWLVELGSGQEADRAQRPALLLVAGLEGDDLAGTASALAWIERLASRYDQDPAIRQLLDSSTIYVLPRLNPDTAESYFAKPQVAQTTNRRPTDDDRDRKADEDPPDDLNGDGLITWMRLEDPEGEFILDPVEPRLLVKADRMRGERGAWKLLTEGIDNDQDEAWNEDGPGGVNFNRNFPFNYRHFAPGAGAFQVGEAETRALADFVVAHPNIGIVFTFGAADNLVQTPKAEPAGKRPPTALNEGDLPFYRESGKAWRETLGLKKELTGSSEPGTFSDWMYFHRGRLSLAARAWSPALQLELVKSKAKAEKTPEKKESSRDDAAARKPSEPDNRNDEDRAFLKWIDEHAPTAFLPWRAIEHPDFPGKKVEVGGFAPFARTVPPSALLEELAGKQARFLTELAGKLPRMGIRKAEARHLGNSVYDLTVQIENTGFLPTAIAQGSATGEVNPTRVLLKLDASAFLAGSPRTLLPAIEGGGGMREVRATVRVKEQKQVEVEVISALGGTARGVIELKAN